MSKFCRFLAKIVSSREGGKSGFFWPGNARSKRIQTRPYAQQFLSSARFDLVSCGGAPLFADAKVVENLVEHILDESFAENAADSPNRFYTLGQLKEVILARPDVRGVKHHPRWPRKFETVTQWLRQVNAYVEMRELGGEVGYRLLLHRLLHH